MHLKKNTEQDDKENYIKMIRRGEIRRPIIRRILLLLKILHLMLVIICVSILFFLELVVSSLFLIFQFLWKYLLERKKHVMGGFHFT